MGSLRDKVRAMNAELKAERTKALRPIRMEMMAHVMPAGDIRALIAKIDECLEKAYTAGLRAGRG